MDARDLLLDELVGLVHTLSRGEQSVLFLESGKALRPLYGEWVAATGSVDVSSVLDLVEEVAGKAADNRSREIVRELEQGMPWGDAVGGLSSTGAQSCWIAYDTSVRLFVDDDLVAAHAVEYLIQPVLEHVSSRLFGFSDVGNGPDEERQIASIVAEQEIQIAADWVRAMATGSRPDRVPVGSGIVHPLLPRK